MTLDLANLSATELAHRLEAMSPAQIDQLPVGVVRLDHQGVVRLFNATEARESGFRKAAVGLDFFHQVAPCMNTPAMRGMIEEAWRQGCLDLEIGWVGDFDDPGREYRIRAVSGAEGSLWLLLDRHLSH